MFGSGPREGGSSPQACRRVRVRLATWLAKIQRPSPGRWGIGILNDFEFMCLVLPSLSELNLLNIFVLSAWPHKASLRVCQSAHPARFCDGRGLRGLGGGIGVTLVSPWCHFCASTGAAHEGISSAAGSAFERARASGGLDPRAWAVQIHM